MWCFIIIFRISDCGFRIPKNPSFFGLIFRIFGLIRIRAKNPRIDNPGSTLYCFCKNNLNKINIGSSYIFIFPYFWTQLNIHPTLLCGIHNINTKEIIEQRNLISYFCLLLDFLSLTLSLSRVSDSEIISS